MISRREIIGALTLLGGGAAAFPFAACAQQPAGKTARIVWLGVGSAPTVDPGAQAFEKGFRDLGYVVGKSLDIEYRWAEGRYERLDALAAELVRLPVDVIFAPTTASALAARKATATIPIVFATVVDPVESGLIASLARPGGNITGLSYQVSTEIVGKRLELLREIRSQVSRVVVLWNPSNPAPANTRLLEEAKTAAGLLGMQLRILEVRVPDDLEGAFQTMAGERTDALLVLPDPIFFEHRAALGKLALNSGLPMMVASREDLEFGSLMAYGASRFDLFRRAAGYIDKILKGAKPADLPVEQPTKFELVINLETARALGLEIPQSLLARADEVIE